MHLQEYDIQRIQIGTRYRRDLGAEGMDWNAFVQSIKDKGIIQPITITKKGLLVAGERRLKAAKEAGLDTVPVIIREESSEELDLREIELAENLFRKDLIWSERATLQKRIFDLMKEKDPKWSLRKQAELSDEAKTSIARQLKMADAI